MIEISHSMRKSLMRIWSFLRRRCLGSMAIIRCELSMSFFIRLNMYARKYIVIAISTTCSAEKRPI